VKDVEIGDIVERERCIEERSSGHMEGESLDGRARYPILSPVIALGGAGGSSSKGDVTLYKAIGGSAPKTCKAHFVTGHKRV